MPSTPPLSVSPGEWLSYTHAWLSFSLLFFVLTWTLLVGFVHWALSEHYTKPKGHSSFNPDTHKSFFISFRRELSLLLFILWLFPVMMASVAASLSFAYAIV